MVVWSLPSVEGSRYPRSAHRRATLRGSNPADFFPAGRHDIERSDSFRALRGTAFLHPAPAHHIAGAVALVIPVCKAAVLIRGKETANLLQCGDIFLIGGVPAIFQPCVQADAGCRSASPSGQPVIPRRVASSPAIATRAKRFTARPT